MTNRIMRCARRGNEKLCDHPNRFCAEHWFQVQKLHWIIKNGKWNVGSLCCCIIHRQIVARSHGSCRYQCTDMSNINWHFKLYGAAKSKEERNLHRQTSSVCWIPMPAFWRVDRGKKKVKGSLVTGETMPNKSEFPHLHSRISLFLLFHSTVGMLCENSISGLNWIGNALSDDSLNEINSSAWSIEKKKEIRFVVKSSSSWESSPGSLNCLVTVARGDERWMKRNGQQRREDQKIRRASQLVC